MANSAGGIDSHDNGHGNRKACPVVFTKSVPKSFGRSAPDLYNIRIVDIGKSCGIALLHLKHARSDAGDLAFELDSTLLAHPNPLTDAKIQDMRTHGFRRRVFRLRRPCCWDKDCKDRDDSNPTRWFLAQEICLFHAPRC